MANNNLEDHEKETLIDNVLEHAMMDGGFMREVVRYYVDEWTRKEFDDWFQNPDDDLEYPSGESNCQYGDKG